MRTGFRPVCEVFLPLFFVVIMTALPALCSEGAQEAHHGGLADLAVYWLNFLIYLGALFFILRKPVGAGWAARRNKIESDVIGGKIEIDAAEKKISDMRDRMDLIGDEIERIRDATEKEAERESAELVDAARVRAQRSSQRMRDSCAAEQRSAENSIRRQLAELALKMVRERLSGEITAENDKRYRNAVVERAGRLMQ